MNLTKIEAAFGRLLDPGLCSLLECPRCRSGLNVESGNLVCSARHKYPIVDGVPVFILPEREQTIGLALASLAAVDNAAEKPLYLSTLGISADGKARLASAWTMPRQTDSVDPVVSALVGATGGRGYAHAVGRLRAYPIPKNPSGKGDGHQLLDIGCSWGRWSMAAARDGWKVVGIDPSLGAIMAARRAFGTEFDIQFVCGDARFLPFKKNTFRAAFSYSVLQHFSEPDAELAVLELGRVLEPGGVARIQMAHRAGLRSTYIRSRPDYLAGGRFRVRYWSLTRLRQVFTERIGPTAMVAEAFGGLGLLAEDWRVVSYKAKLLIALSSLLKQLARMSAPLVRLADSVYVISTKP